MSRMMRMVSIFACMLTILTASVDRIVSGWVVIELDGSTAPIHIPVQLFQDMPREGAWLSIQIADNPAAAEERARFISEYIGRLTDSN